MEYVLAFTVFVNTFTIDIEAVYMTKADCENALSHVIEKVIAVNGAECKLKGKTQ